MQVIVLNKTERMYILSASEYTRRSDGGESKNDILHLHQINLVPGHNTVSKSDLDKIDQKYLGKLVAQGFLEVGNMIGSAKLETSKVYPAPKKRGRKPKCAVEPGGEAEVIGSNAPKGDAVKVVV